MEFAWIEGVFEGEWYVKGDQYCERLNALHMGREYCQNVYIDRDKSDDKTKQVSILSFIGIDKSVFTRVASDPALTGRVYVSNPVFCQTFEPCLA